MLPVGFSPKTHTASPIMRKQQTDPKRRLFYKRSHLEPSKLSRSSTSRKVATLSQQPTGAYRDMATKWKMVGAMGCWDHEGHWMKIKKM